MEHSMETLQACNDVVRRFEAACKKTVHRTGARYRCGVDLGTACVVTAVVDETGTPVAGQYQYADVVRDGMVVDYIRAVDLVREMKRKLETALGAELLYAAAAIPPGTDALDGGAVKNVVQAAGFELTALLDESTAANAVLHIQNGAIVDIGGGTTGISILQGGRVVYAGDEATGGTHFSLALAGAMRLPYEETERYKRDPAHHRELLPILKPVIEKVASIIARHISGWDVGEIYLVGGTSCLGGMEVLLSEKLGIPVYKPENPMFVTPVGIALSCLEPD
ncbi:ethanolamine utilization protein EutJ [Dysosmobacter sp.]|uniref:ethanolamine utilization protein EutJ n=1 Tax=Dysosmobacter sp. TaxID=2591382 RepID=UPI003AB1609F